MKYVPFIIAFFLFVSCHEDESIRPPSDNSIGFFDGESPNEDVPDQSACDTSAPIYDEFDGQELYDLVKFCFTPPTTFSYADARTFLYSNVDVINGKVQCIYSGYEVELSPAPGQSYINAAAAAGVNTEHSFPQSQGAGSGAAQADMFHIYPALADVNTARSNKFFDEIDDNVTARWFYLDQVSTTIPTSDIDNWSESITTAWEPREAIKGDIARGIFYFKTIYDDTASQGFFNQMVETLLEWNDQDPVDQREINRNNKIKELQGNDNPFILDPDLARRIYG